MADCSFKPTAGVGGPEGCKPDHPTGGRGRLLGPLLLQAAQEGHRHRGRRRFRKIFT